ncbi:MAG TPA: pseudouridine synthase [Spirochaetia bacterium]|nr:pseudouridine synthase [Spirochaetia bacterium]
MIDILFRDDEFVAVNKPSGMLVHRSTWCPGEPACLELLREQLGAPVYPVHRIDRATSGIVLFARSSGAAAELSLQFRGRQVRKSYLAVVRGYIEESGRMEDPLNRRDGKEPQAAVTDFTREAIVELHVPVGRYQTGRYSLVRLYPHTGRHHQIRRHLAHVSHPIVGDTKHGDGDHNHFFARHLGINRLLLMATDFMFEHPNTGKIIRIHAPIPEEINRLFALIGWPVEREPTSLARLHLPAPPATTIHFDRPHAVAEAVAMAHAPASV